MLGLSELGKALNQQDKEEDDKNAENELKWLF